MRLRRLTGGIGGATHEVVLDGPQGRRQRLVIRRKHPRWSDAEPDALEREAATLQHLAACGGGDGPGVLPVPELVAVRRDAMLTRKLGGRIDLAPADPASWLAQQADALAAIHDLPPVPGRTHGGWAPDFAERRPPDWSAHPHLWERALEIVRAGHPDPSSDLSARTFVHSDFQHFNLLWTRGRLTGIVDWGGWTLDNPARDVGHCRLNLVILYGTEAADALLSRYVAVTGRPVDPWWDLFETVVFLPSWASTILAQVRSRIRVDVDAMHARVDAHLPTLLAKL